jgi:hypothetical protein
LAAGINGHSELSVIEYASDLRTFFRYLAKEKNLYPPDTPDDQMDLRQINMDFIKTITLSDAYQFLIYCKNQRGNAEATRARRVIAIRRFFIYLTDNRHLLEENPMKVLDAPKTKKALPKYMTLEEARHLLSIVDGRYKERDYAILTLLLTNPPYKRHGGCVSQVDLQHYFSQFHLVHKLKPRFPLLYSPFSSFHFDIQQNYLSATLLFPVPLGP